MMPDMFPAGCQVAEGHQTASAYAMVAESASRPL